MNASCVKKECIRCHVMKNINEYRRNKKTNNRICNECGGLSGKRICPKCGVKKFKNAFQRSSQNNINCNACAKKSEDFINECFDRAFNLFNILLEGRNMCKHL